MDALWQDLKYAARSLRRAPGFATAVLLTLGIGIGGTTAIFSVVDAVVLRPLAYKESDRLFAVHEIIQGGSVPRIPVNAAHFQEWQRSVRSFEQIAIIQPRTLTLLGRSEPVIINGARTSPSLFPLLGIQALHGRTFTAEEAQQGRDNVAVLGHDLWVRQFGADPGAIGDRVTLEGQPFTIIGVLPAGAELPRLSHLYPLPLPAGRSDIWLPFVANEGDLRIDGSFNFAALARLKPGISAVQALSELEIVQRGIGRQMTGTPDLRAALIPLKDQIAGSSRAGLQLMLATVAIILLVGCINIANLLLARGASRQRELAIRQAAGADRMRLIGQLLVESLLISTIGGILGVLIARATVEILVTTAPVEIPRLDEVGLDGRVLLFAMVASLGSGLLVGLLPAWRLSKTDLQDTLKSATSRSISSRSGNRVRAILVGSEVAASTACVIVAGLLVSSFATLLRVDAGFSRTQVVGGRLTLPPRERAETTRLLDALRDSVRAIPGIISVGVSNRLPVDGLVSNSGVAVEGATLTRLQQPMSTVRIADAGYFETLGIPLLRGRLMEDADRRRSPVAVISKSAAERLWPGQDAIGKRFQTGPGENRPFIEVIGIVGDVRGVSLDSPPRLDLYYPYWYLSFGQMALTVKTTSNPETLAPALQDAIRRLEPAMAVPAFQRIDDIVAESVAPRRFQMNLILLFAITALLLASLGIYGTVSYSVAQRRNEIGVRMALGARPGRIRRMVLVQAAMPVAVGITAGILVALAASDALRALLFEVAPTDPAVLITSASLLGSVALLASYFPARRATRVDPIQALRAE